MPFLLTNTSKRIAVGTAVTSRPPHRSVRDGLRHTAPPLGRTIEENSVTCRACRATPIDARSGSESGASVTVQQDFPSVTSFPRRTPPLRSQFCSPVSMVLRSHLNSQKRSCQHCPRRGSLAAQGVNRQAALHLRLMGSPAPVILENAGAFGMSTHAQVLRLRRVRRCLAINGSDDAAFSLSGQDRHTKVVMSELNGWPALPFARTLKTDRSPDPPLR